MFLLGRLRALIPPVVFGSQSRSKLTFWTHQPSRLPPGPSTDFVLVICSLCRDEALMCKLLTPRNPRESKRKKLYFPKCKCREARREVCGGICTGSLGEECGLGLSRFCLWANFRTADERCRKKSFLLFIETVLTFFFLPSFHHSLSFFDSFMCFQPAAGYGQLVDV